jgi:hypothetical protein
MNKMIIILAAIFASSAFAGQETTLKDSRLLGDCKNLNVLKKKLNGKWSIAITEDPSVAFSALAPAGINTVSKKCIIDMQLLVPANHKVGVYDPNPATNHMQLGRFNGIQNLYDNDSKFKYEVSWDLQDPAAIPFQTANYAHVGPLFSNYFGGDFQAVVPHQWSACKRKPQMVNLKIAIQLMAKSSEQNSAELVFRNAHVKLTTQKCLFRPIPPRRGPRVIRGN